MVRCALLLLLSHVPMGARPSPIRYRLTVANVGTLTVLENEGPVAAVARFSTAHARRLGHDVGECASAEANAERRNARAQLLRHLHEQGLCVGADPNAGCAEHDLAAAPRVLLPCATSPRQDVAVTTTAQTAPEETDLAPLGEHAVKNDAPTARAHAAAAAAAAAEQAASSIAALCTSPAACDIGVGVLCRSRSSPRVGVHTDAEGQSASSGGSLDATLVVTMQATLPGAAAVNLTARVGDSAADILRAAAPRMTLAARQLAQRLQRPLEAELTQSLASAWRILGVGLLRQLGGEISDSSSSSAAAGAGAGNAVGGPAPVASGTSTKQGDPIDASTSGMSAWPLPPSAAQTATAAAMALAEAFVHCGRCVRMGCSGGAVQAQHSVPGAGFRQAGATRLGVLSLWHTWDEPSSTANELALAVRHAAVPLAAALRLIGRGGCGSNNTCNSGMEGAATAGSGNSTVHPYATLQRAQLSLLRFAVAARPTHHTYLANVAVLTAEMARRRVRVDAAGAKSVLGESVDALKRALALAPDDRPALFNLATLVIEASKAEARAQAKAEAEAQPHALGDAGVGERRALRLYWQHLLRRAPQHVMRPLHAVTRALVKATIAEGAGRTVVSGDGAIGGVGGNSSNRNVSHISELVMLDTASLAWAVCLAALRLPVGNDREQSASDGANLTSNRKWGAGAAWRDSWHRFERFIPAEVLRHLGAGWARVVVALTVAHYRKAGAPGTMRASRVSVRLQDSDKMQAALALCRYAAWLQTSAGLDIVNHLLLLLSSEYSHGHPHSALRNPWRTLCRVVLQWQQQQQRQRQRQNVAQLVIEYNGHFRVAAQSLSPPPPGIERTGFLTGRNNTLRRRELLYALARNAYTGPPFDGGVNILMPVIEANAIVAETGQSTTRAALRMAAQEAMREAWRELPLDHRKAAIVRACRRLSESRGASGAGGTGATSLSLSAPLSVLVVGGKGMQGPALRRQHTGRAHDGARSRLSFGDVLRFANGTLLSCSVASTFADTTCIVDKLSVVRETVTIDLEHGPNGFGTAADSTVVSQDRARVGGLCGTIGTEGTGNDGPEALGIDPAWLILRQKDEQDLNSEQTPEDSANTEADVNADDGGIGDASMRPIAVLANADIVFDESLHELPVQRGLAYALARWEWRGHLNEYETADDDSTPTMKGGGEKMNDASVGGDGGVGVGGDGGGGGEDIFLPARIDSQDAWVLFPPLPALRRGGRLQSRDPGADAGDDPDARSSPTSASEVIDVLSFPMGRPGSDNRVAAVLAGPAPRSGGAGLGLHVSNPCFLARTVHVHADDRRQYADEAGEAAPPIVRGDLQLLPISVSLPVAGAGAGAAGVVAGTGAGTGTGTGTGTGPDTLFTGRDDALPRSMRY